MDKTVVAVLQKIPLESRVAFLESYTGMLLDGENHETLSIIFDYRYEKIWWWGRRYSISCHHLSRESGVIDLARCTYEGDRPSFLEEVHTAALD